MSLVVHSTFLIVILRHLLDCVPPCGSCEQCTPSDYASFFDTVG